MKNKFVVYIASINGAIKGEVALIYTKMGAETLKTSKFPQSYLSKSHLYVSPLKPLVGVEDTDTNGNISCAPLWCSIAMQLQIDVYHKGKVPKLSWSNRKHDRASVHFLNTVLKHRLS